MGSIIRYGRAFSTSESDSGNQGLTNRPRINFRYDESKEGSLKDKNITALEFGLIFSTKSWSTSKNYYCCISIFTGVTDKNADYFKNDREEYWGEYWSKTKTWWYSKDEGKTFQDLITWNKDSNGNTDYSQSKPTSIIRDNLSWTGMKISDDITILVEKYNSSSKFPITSTDSTLFLRGVAEEPYCYLKIYYEDGDEPSTPPSTGSGTIHYHDGTEWVECEVYYHDGTEWKRCEPHYYDGTNWVLCG